MTRVRKGRYEAPGQLPIIVVDDGALSDGRFGPWVEWRFEWEPTPTKSLFNHLERLFRECGYQWTGA